MRLHHGMALQRRGVGDVDLDRGAGERGCKVTNRAIGSRTIILVWHEGSIEVRTQRISSARAVIFHTDQVSRGSGLLESLGNYEGNRLAVTRHLRAGENRVGLTVVAGALGRCVLVGEN